MATANDIIKPALRRINVLAKNEEIDATDARDSLAALNALLNSYKARGCDEINPEVGSPSDEVTVDSKFHMFLSDLLARRLCSEFGVAVDARLERDAEDADRAILKHFVIRGEFGVDSALLPVRMSSWGRTRWL